MVDNIKDKIYYQTDLGTLYHADCLQIMPHLKPVDLVLTDPPYGVRKKENWDDYNYFIKNYSKWLDWCLLTGRCVLWFCAIKMMPIILEGRQEKFHRLLIWDKPEGSHFAGAMHSNIWYSIEPILVFGNPPKTDKNKKYGYSSFKSRTIPKKTFNHPTSKPEWLMYELAYFYTNKNGNVLDPFTGSGSTLIACERLNRRWIGIEIEEKYCEIAAKRIENERKQLKLF